jgi:hypothetical protein
VGPTAGLDPVQKKNLLPYQDSNHNSWAIQPAAILTKLSQLLIMKLPFSVPFVLNLFHIFCPNINVKFSNAGSIQIWVYGFVV